MSGTPDLSLILRPGTPPEETRGYRSGAGFGLSALPTTSTRSSPEAGRRDFGPLALPRWPPRRIGNSQTDHPPKPPANMLKHVLHARGTCCLGTAGSARRQNVAQPIWHRAAATAAVPPPPCATLRPQRPHKKSPCVAPCRNVADEKDSRSRPSGPGRGNYRQEGPRPAESGEP